VLAETARKRLSAASVRTSVTVPLQIADGSYAQTQMVTFHGLADEREHIAVIFKDALSQSSPLIRVHSECLTGDVFRSVRCDCGAQCQEAITLMQTHGGVLLYLRQEGRGIGLYNKIEAYSLQDMGMDTFEANRALNFKDDQRDYAVAAQMLMALGLHRVEILSNNPEKARQLREAGITVSRQRSTRVHLTEANRSYLQAKRKYADHAINFDRGSM
jgi:GTP cyclohydrolase II